MNQTSERIGSRLHRLSEVSMMKQVEPLSYALFPGYHCPLMGAMLTIGKIRDAVMLVIGPDECTYYTKMATSDGGRMASEGCQIVSVVLDQHDVTFGCKEAITEAFHELNEEYHPKCVFAVTTCVPEVTGDDVESMAAVFSSQYGFPVVVVHAENFKTDDHMPGIEHTLTGCLPLMQPKECNGSVNVLGLRLGADDYIVKPFAMDELLARLRTAIRHTRTTSGNASIAKENRFTARGLVIDYDKYRVYIDGRDARLTQNEFKLVALLGRFAGRVLTYDYLIREIWGPNKAYDNQILRVNMANIRRKIEKNPAEPEYIFTEVGVGYRMIEGD
mgnify:CR=1 FL=1